MLAKSVQGKSFKGLSDYLYEGKEYERTADFKKAEVISHSDNLRVPFDYNDKEGRRSMVNDFEQQANTKIGKPLKEPVGHHMISFDPQDKEILSDQKIIEATNDYIKERGLSNTQYVAIRHHDTDKEHVHIAFNRVDNNGKSIEANRYFENSVTSYDISKKHGFNIPDKLRQKVEQYEEKNPEFRQGLKHKYKANIEALSKTDKVTDLRNSNELLKQSKNLHHLKKLSEAKGVQMSYNKEDKKADVSFDNKAYNRKELEAAFKANREESKTKTEEKKTERQPNKTPDYQIKINKIKKPENDISKQKNAERRKLLEQQRIKRKLQEETKRKQLEKRKTKTRGMGR